MANEAMKIARLQARTELTSQAMSLLADPLWSTVLGFAVIHELRRRDMIGPVADDVLYAGVIAINTARQPAIMELAGKGISAAAGAVGAAAGAAGAVGAVAVGQKLLARGKGPASFTKALSLASKGTGTLTVLPPGSMPNDTNQKEYSAAVREGKWWQIWRAF